MISFLALVSVALVAYLLALRFNIPQVITMLLAGLIIGPAVLNIIPYDENIKTMAELGATLMLFVIGIEFDVSKLLSSLFRASIVYILKLFLVFILTYEVFIIFSFKPLESTILALALSFTSTAFFSSFIKNEKLEKEKEASLLIAVLILEDISAVFLISYFNQLGESFEIIKLATSFVYSLIPITISYLVIKGIVDKIVDRLASYKNKEILIYFSFALCGLFAGITQYFGLDATTGAFLAGSIVGATKPLLKIEKDIGVFMAVFFSLFILSIGMMINLQAIASNFWLIIILAIINSSAKAIGTSIGMKTTGFKQVIPWGIMMMTTGEFSLIITQKISIMEATSIVSGVIFLSTIISQISYQHKERIEKEIKRRMDKNLIKNFENIAKYIDRTIKAFEPKGRFARTFNKTLGEIKGGIILSIILWIILGAIGVGLIYLNILQGELISWYSIASGLLIILPASSVLFGIKKIIDEFVGAIYRFEEEKNTWDRLAMNLIFLFLLFAGSVIWNITITFLNLPGIFKHASLIILLFGLIIIWDSIKSVEKMIIGRKRYKYNKKMEKILKGIPKI